MLTKNIKFTNFRGNTNSSNKKKLAKILKNKNLVIEIPLLKSLSKDYQLSYSKKLVSSLKKFKKINLIGMGGSILGTQAIYDFLKDKITKKINFFDNLQSREFNTNKEKNINIIVSKSGNTLETITNHNLISLKEKKNKNLFITETKDSFLTQLANKLKAEIIEHKNFIGGRYSVLSEVGMLPAELMGLKEKRFKNFNNLIKNKNFSKLLINNIVAINQLILKKKIIL